MLLLYFSCSVADNSTAADGAYSWRTFEPSSGGDTLPSGC